MIRGCCVLLSTIVFLVGLLFMNIARSIGPGFTAYLYLEPDEAGVPFSIGSDPGNYTGYPLWIIASILLIVGLTGVVSAFTLKVQKTNEEAR